MNRITLALCGALSLAGSMTTAHAAVTPQQVAALSQSTEGLPVAFDSLLRSVDKTEVLQAFELAVQQYPTQKESLLSMAIAATSSDMHVALTKAAILAGLDADTALVASVAGGADPLQVGDPTAFGFGSNFGFSPALLNSIIATAPTPPAPGPIVVTPVSVH